MLLKLLWELWRGNLCGIEKSKSLRFSITHSYSTSVPMFMFPFLPLPAASNISSVIPLSSYTDVLYSAKIKEKRKKKNSHHLSFHLFLAPAQGSHWSICLTKPRLFLQGNSAIEKLYFLHIVICCVLEICKVRSGAGLSSLQLLSQARRQSFPSLGTPEPC